MMEVAGQFGRTLRAAARYAAQNDQRVIALGDVPLLRVRREFGLSIAVPLLDPIHPYPLQLFPALATPQGVCGLLEAARRTGADLLRFRYVEAEHAARFVSASSNLQLVRHETAICDIDPDGATGSLRKLLRDKSNWRRLSKTHGPLSFHVAHDVLERVRLLNQLLSWKADWLRSNKLRASGFYGPVHVATLKFLASQEVDDGLLLHCIKAGETPIAIEACLDVRPALLNLLTSYAPHVEAYGVGTLLSKMATAHASEQCFETVDFLPPASAHKQRFAKRIEPVFEMRCAFTLKGKGALTVDRLRSAFETSRQIKPSTISARVT